MINGLIDLHAHVLPGVDDGPANVTGSISLLRALANQGVTTVVAVAHTCDGLHRATRAAILSAAERLVGALPDDLAALTLVPSMELGLTLATLKAASAGQLLPIGRSRYVAVDVPRGGLPLCADQVLFGLMLEGYSPLIVHPELNRDFLDSPERLDRLVALGIMPMVTAPSLLGRWGPGPRRLARVCLKRDTAVLCSDAHGTETRPPLLAAAISAAPQKQRGQPRERQLLMAACGGRGFGTTD